MRFTAPSEVHCHSRFWHRPSPHDAGSQARWANGKSPIIGTFTRQVTAASEAAQELRALGKRLHNQFRSRENATVMIFDDTAAAREVRKGSRNVDETRFQAALIHQRAMYLKSAGRGENSFTIYKSYPVVGEVMRFDDDLRKTSR